MELGIRLWLEPDLEQEPTPKPILYMLQLFIF
jgi:hypothetical protein